MSSRGRNSLWLKTVGLSFRNDIAGLRAVAVLAVVIYHLKPEILPGGFAGVDVFFALSGFLIAGILWREYKKHGAISLSRFYSRRAKRLIPAAVTVIIATVFASSIIMPYWMLDGIFWQSAAAFLYSANIWFATQGSDYFTASMEMPRPLLHMWTLGVEEQFYFILPVLLVALIFLARGKSKSKSTVVVGLSLLTVASFAMSVFLSPVFPTESFFLLHTRFWEFSFGALIAVALINDDGEYLAISRGRGLLTFVGLIGLASSFWLLDYTDVYPGYLALLPVVSTLLILATHPSTMGNRLLGLKPMVAVGNLSYSWYLWHYPPIVLAGVAGYTLTGSVLWLVAGIGFAGAVLSYLYVEKPLRYREWTWVQNSAQRVISSTLILCVALAGMSVVGGVLVSRAKLQAEEAHQAMVTSQQNSSTPAKIGSVEPPVDATQVSPPGDDSSEPAEPAITTPLLTDLEGMRVVLVGDSHSLHWEAAFTQVVEELGGELVMHSLLSCPAIDVYVTKLDGSSMRAGCEEHRETFWEVAAEADVIVLSQAEHYIKRIRSADAQRVSDEEKAILWENAYVEWLTRAEGLGIPLGVVQDNPKMPGNPASCVKFGSNPSECDVALTDIDSIMGEIPQASSKARNSFLDPEVQVMPVFDWICNETTCKASDEFGAIFADNQHLDEEWTLRQADQVRDFLLGVVNTEVASEPIGK